jgi:hypothetical protein
MPFLPTQPTRKPCAVYNLPEESFRGMEEVIGPIRSGPPKKHPPYKPITYKKRPTSFFEHLVANYQNLYQDWIQKCVRFPLSSALRRRFSLQLFFLSTSTTLERDALPSILALR